MHLNSTPNFSVSKLDSNTQGWGWGGGTWLFALARCHSHLEKSAPVGSSSQSAKISWVGTQKGSRSGHLCQLRTLRHTRSAQKRQSWTQGSNFHRWKQLISCWNQSDWLSFFFFAKEKVSIEHTFIFWWPGYTTYPSKVLSHYASLAPLMEFW